MQRSRYPGQRDSEKDRIERFYQLIAGILRRALRIDGAPPGRSGDDDQRGGENAAGSHPDEGEHTQTVQRANGWPETLE